jgi:hypothetical protein
MSRSFCFGCRSFAELILLGNVTVGVRAEPDLRRVNVFSGSVSALGHPA